MMKQLADGGLAFYMNKAHASKAAVKLILPRFIGALLGVPLIMFLVHPTTSLSWTALLGYVVIFYICILGLGLGIGFLIHKFGKITPSCTVYDSYIMWKDKQTGIRTPEKKLFFKDIQGFFIKKETVFPGKAVLEENVICFVMKDPKVHAPFYPYYAWLSTQDQQLLIELLKEKGLTFLPGDYQPN